MASRTISLEESAYQRLRAEKRPGESFSKVVNRLTAPQNDPMSRLVGLVDPARGRAMRDVLDAKRELDRDATIERYKRLGLF